MIQRILFYPFRVVLSGYFDDDHLTSFLTGAFTVGLLWLLHVLHQCVPDKFTKDRIRSDGTIDDDDDDDDDFSFVDSWNAPLAYVSTQQRRMVRSSISTMADIQKHIGELPRRLKRKHWPWETIRRKVMGEESDSDDNSLEETLMHAQTLNEASESSVSGTADNETQTQDATTIPSEVEAGSKQKKKEEKQLCIGSIFGLDVGGTLAKLVYFEKKSLDSDPLYTRTLREKQYAQALSAQTVIMARVDDGGNGRAKRSASMSPLRSPQSPQTLLQANRYRSSTVEEYEFTETEAIKLQPPLPPPVYHASQPYPRRRTVAKHVACPLKIKDHEGDQPERGRVLFDDDEPDSNGNKPSSEDLKSLYAIRQESLPDDLRQFRHIVDDSDDENDSFSHQPTNFPQSPAMATPTAPKTLKKRSLSMLDLSTQHEQQKAEALNRFYDFARRLDTHEDSISDIQLSFYCRELGGEFHFISFETRKMKNAMDLIRFNNLHMNIRNMGATGGGAHKFADIWEKELAIGMIKQDELDSLVAGMQFVLSTVVGECYTFRPKQEPIAEAPSDGERNEETEPSTSNSRSSNDNDNDNNNNNNKTDKKNPKLERWTRKVQRDTISYSSAYPYMLVTIGTGVSVLRVDGPRIHERVSGSTIGGGTFWGLMRLLTDAENFEDAMKLAEKGDPTKVDMMVGDIYGEDSDALEKLGLAADIVASSFGKLVSKDDPAKGLTQEDLARALLSLVTNNIGQVAYLNAKLHNTPRIYFVGSFLRLNMISQRRLSYAIDYWSKGEMEALFLEHEGYFGALGAFLMTQNIETKEGGFFQWENTP